MNSQPQSQQSNFILRIAALDHSRLFFIASLLLVPWMISNDSFWIDEGGTAMFALQPDFASWLNFLNRNEGADCQMPLAMFFAWLTGKVIGTQEWQLRSINALWAVLTLYAASLSGRRLNVPWLPLLFAVQPFLWFYTNELRPYALQICAGSYLLLGALEWLHSKPGETRWAWIIAAGGVALGLATMLAPVTFLTLALVLGGMTVRNGWSFSWSVLRPFLVAGLLLNPIGVYYAFTIRRGVSSAQLWEVSPLTIGYVCYELIGLTGLGPPISTIRENVHAMGAQQFLLTHAVSFTGAAVLFFSLAALALLVLLRRPQKPYDRTLILLGGSLAVFSLILIAGSFAAHKAFWARHFAPIFPFYVAFLGVAIARAWSERSGRLLAIATILLVTISSLSLRFNPQYRKEDYRSAAAEARRVLSEGRTLWWFSNPECADYYGLPITFGEPEPKVAVAIGRRIGGGLERPYASDLTVLPTPDEIIFSKPNIFDPLGKLADLVARGGFVHDKTIRGFTIYRRE